MIEVVKTTSCPSTVKKTGLRTFKMQPSLLIVHDDGEHGTGRDTTRRQGVLLLTLVRHLHAVIETVLQV